MCSLDFPCLPIERDKFFKSLYPNLHHTEFSDRRIHGRQYNLLRTLLPVSHSQVSYHETLKHHFDRPATVCKFGRLGRGLPTSLINNLS
jgi:hypothetical protein